MQVARPTCSFDFPKDRGREGFWTFLRSPRVVANERVTRKPWWLEKRLKAQRKSPLAPGDLGYARLRGCRKGFGLGRSSGVKCFPHKCDDLCLVPSTCVKGRAC